MQRRTCSWCRISWQQMAIKKTKNMEQKTTALIGQCYISLRMARRFIFGESDHVKTRMSQHHMSVEKSIFDKVHFIYSKNLISQ